MPSLRDIRPNLERRSEILRLIRGFFHERGFMEAETPLRIPHPALELHIDAEPSGDFFLRTSPELHLKRLVAAGCEKVFQLGPCFRRGERGDLHHPEFTMLEWYRTGTDYRGILEDTRALFKTLTDALVEGTQLVYRDQAIALDQPWREFTVQEAFLEFAGWDPVADYDADRFDLDLVNKVEPNLPRGIPVVMTDYPAEAAALSRRKPDQPEVAERWELYIGGMEIANAYSELTDAVEQRERFEACRDERLAMGKPGYALDEAFLEALESGLPPCGGIALGIDRLVMLFTSADSLDQVIAFRE